MDTTMNTPINPMPELAPLLKQLRLSGLMDSLAQRNREAIEGKLAYTEFLALVVQDEVARRDQKKFASRVRRAGFRGEKTLEGFDFSKHPTLNQELIRDLATCRFIEEKVSLLIAGPCGTGKSHIAQALGIVQSGRVTMCCSPPRPNCWVTCTPRVPSMPLSAGSRAW